MWQCRPARNINNKTLLTSNANFMDFRGRTRTYLSSPPTSSLPTSCVLLADHQGETPLSSSSTSSLPTSCVLADYRGETPLLVADIFTANFMCSYRRLPGGEPLGPLSPRGRCHHRRLHLLFLQVTRERPPLLVVDVFTADFMCSCRLPGGEPLGPPSSCR